MSPDQQNMLKYPYSMACSLCWTITVMCDWVLPQTESSSLLNFHIVRKNYLVFITKSDPLPQLERVLLLGGKKRTQKCPGTSSVQISSKNMKLREAHGEEMTLRTICIQIKFKAFTSE